MMNLKTKQKIASLAEYINGQYGNNGYIEPEKIAYQKGITFSYGHYREAFDGMLEYSDNRFHIYINLERGKYPTSSRSRFTFCHELGHYFLDEHRNALITGASKPHKSKIDFSSDLTVEKEADLFAANLLMPRKVLKDKIGKSNLSASLIIQIADFFGTSISSTAIRIRELNLFPFLLLKTDGEKISWIRSSKKLKKLGLKYPIKKFTDLTKGCLTQTYSNNELKSSKTLKKGTTAASWFNTSQKITNLNPIMIEEIISLGNYGLITIVYPDYE